MSEGPIRNFESENLEGYQAIWCDLIDRQRKLHEDDSIGRDAPGPLFDRYLERVGAQRVWVAREDGRLVGLASLLIQENDEREIPEIESVVVALNRRGRGIGGMLVDAAVAGAARFGATYLCVRPVARNHDALAFFHSACFHTLGHIHLFTVLKEIERQMWKTGIQLAEREFGS
jgi:GNAT superfamily N-acetyltransferase